MSNSLRVPFTQLHQDLEWLGQSSKVVPTRNTIEDLYKCLLFLNQGLHYWWFSKAVRSPAHRLDPRCWATRSGERSGIGLELLSARSPPASFAQDQILPASEGTLCAAMLNTRASSQVTHASTCVYSWLYKTMWGRKKSIRLSRKW